MHPSSIGTRDTKQLLGRAYEQNHGIDIVAEDRRRFLPGFPSNALVWLSWHSAAEAGNSIANGVSVTGPTSGHVADRTRVLKSLRAIEHADASWRERR